MSVAPLSVLLPVVLMGLAPVPETRAGGVPPAPTVTGSGTHPGADALSGVGEDALTEVIFDEVTVTLDPRGGGFSGEGRIVFRHTLTDGRCPGGSFDTPVELRYHGAYLPAPDGLIVGTVALDVGPTSRSPACPDDPFRYVGPGTDVSALLARVDLPTGRITEEMGVFGFAVDIPPEQLRPSPTPLQWFLSTGDFDMLGRRSSPDDDVALARWLTLAGGADGTLAGRGEIVELTEIGDCKAFIVSDIVAALRVDDATHQVAGEFRIDETIRPFTCDDIDAIARDLVQEARTGTIMGVLDPATGRLTLDPLVDVPDLEAFNPLTLGDRPGPAVNAGSIGGTPVQFRFDLAEALAAFGDIGLVPEVVTNGGELAFGPDGTVIGGSGAATVEGTSDDGSLSVRSASTYRFLPSDGAGDGTARRGEVLHGTIVEVREDGDLLGVDIVDHPPNRYEVDPAAGIGNVIADAEGTVFGLTFPPFIAAEVSAGPGSGGDAGGNPVWPWGGLLLGGLLGGGTLLGARRRRASRTADTTTPDIPTAGGTTVDQPGHVPGEGLGDEERSAWIGSELDGIAQKAWVIDELTPEAREELIHRAEKVRAALRPWERETPTEEVETDDLLDLLIRYLSAHSPRAVAVAEELPAAWRERHSENRTNVVRELMHPAERSETHFDHRQLAEEMSDLIQRRHPSGSGDRTTPPDDQTSESRAGDAPRQEVDPPGDIREVLLGRRRRRRQLSADDPGDDPADDGRPADGPGDEERSTWIGSELDGIAQKAWVIDELTPEAREELIQRAEKVRAALRPGERDTPTEETETAALLRWLVLILRSAPDTTSATEIAEELPTAWRERHTRGPDFIVDRLVRAGVLEPPDDSGSGHPLSGSGDRTTPPDDQTSESRAGDAPRQEVDPPGDIREVLLGRRRRRRQLSGDDPGDDPADDSRPADGSEDRADGDDGDHPQG